MRVTESANTQALTRTLQEQQKRIHRASNEITSGKRVTRPSDDPIAAGGIERLQAATKRYEHYLKISERMEGEYSQVDTALQTSSDILTRIREIGVAAQAGTQPDDVRENSVELLEELKEALISAANTKYQDRFVFGGVNDQDRPFDANGAFAGSNDVRSIEVGPQVNVQQISGAEVFSGANGGVDIFSTIDDLQTALTNNDQSALQTALTSFQDAQDQIASMQQKLGNAFETVSQASNFARDLILNYDVQSSVLEDADVADAVYKLQSAQVALDASTRMAQQMNNLQLFMNL